MQRPISLKVYSVAVSLLALMIIVTGLSARNLKSLNNEVMALSEYYIPLDQQVGGVETLIRQQAVHLERILLLQRLGGDDRAALEQETKLFDDRGVNADQIVDSSMRLIEKGLASESVQVDRAAFDLLRKELPAIQTARQNLHATFRKFLTEAEEGNPRSIQIVREAVLKDRDDINAQLEKAIFAIQNITQNSAARAQTEEVKAIRLNWGITMIAGVLGLIFAAIITRSLVQPVRRLLSGTKAVEEGDLSIRIHADHPTGQTACSQGQPQRGADESDAGDPDPLEHDAAHPLSAGDCTRRPSAAARGVSSPISAAKVSNVSCCGPSLRALSGSGWTSMMSPSAPTATAARDNAGTYFHFPAAWLGSMMIGRCVSCRITGTAERSSMYRV